MSDEELPESPNFFEHIFFERILPIIKFVIFNPWTIPILYYIGLVFLTNLTRYIDIYESLSKRQMESIGRYEGCLASEKLIGWEHCIEAKYYATCWVFWASFWKLIYDQKELFTTELNPVSYATSNMASLIPLCYYAMKWVASAFISAFFKGKAKYINSKEAKKLQLIARSNYGNLGLDGLDRQSHLFLNDKKTQ